MIELTKKTAAEIWDYFHKHFPERENKRINDHADELIRSFENGARKNQAIADFAVGSVWFRYDASQPIITWAIWKV